MKIILPSSENGSGNLGAIKSAHANDDRIILYKRSRLVRSQFVCGCARRNLFTVSRASPHTTQRKRWKTVCDGFFITSLSLASACMLTLLVTCAYYVHTFHTFRWRAVAALYECSKQAANRSNSGASIPTTAHVMCWSKIAHNNNNKEIYKFLFAQQNEREWRRRHGAAALGT